MQKELAPAMMLNPTTRLCQTSEDNAGQRGLTVAAEAHADTLGVAELNAAAQGTQTILLHQPIMLS